MKMCLYIGLVLTLSLVSTVCSGKIGYPFIGGFSPLIQTPLLNLFGSFNGLNLGLTHLHKPVPLPIPRLFGHGLLPKIGHVYSGLNLFHQPTGGIVIGLHGLQIGVVVLTWDGRPVAYDPNHLYLGNVVPNLLGGNPLVVGPLGNIIGHVIYGHHGPMNTHHRPSNPGSSLLIIRNNNGQYTGPLDPSVPCRGDGALCIPTTG